MKTIPIKMTTVDLTSGRSVTKPANWFLMPPHPDACQVCARNPAHPPGQPHNADSLYYKYAFYGEHGRWPTWADAIAHCSDETRALWEDALRCAGVWPA